MPITPTGIQRKTFFLIIASVSLLVGAIFLVSWVTVMGGFERLENEFLQKNISRTKDLIKDRINNLAVKLSDWTTWDDTYAFIEDKNEAFIKSNLTPIVLENLKINTMVFLNIRGELVYALNDDPGEGVTNHLPKGLKQYLAKGSVLLAHADEKSSIEGIVMLPAGPLMVASKPIVQSDGKGPVHGAMIFAKRFDANELKSLGNVIGANLDAQEFDAVSLPFRFSSARAAFLKGEKTFIKTFGSETIAGYSILKDLSGKDVLILKVAVPREITQFGKQTLFYFFVALLVVGFIFGIVVYIPLEKEITERNLAEKRFIQIAEATEEFIWEVDKDGLYTYVNSIIEKMLGYKIEEVVGKKHFFDFFIPEDKERMTQETLEFFAKEKNIKNYIKRNRHRDGKTVITSMTGVPIVNARGGLSGYRGVDVDITEQVKNQGQLLNDKKLLEEKSGELQKALEESLRSREILSNLLAENNQVRKQLEQSMAEVEKNQQMLLQSEKLASIGQLAAGIAHEINNPTGFIGSNLFTLDKYMADITRLFRLIETLKAAIESGDFEETRKIEEDVVAFEKEIDISYVFSDADNLLRESKEGILRITNIVRDLKVFSHVHEDVLVSSSVCSIIESVINIVWNEIKYKAELKKNYVDDPWVTCNPQQIGQVFINLLVNAAQAIKDRGVISIKTYVSEEFAHVEISDTGCGIPKENINKIFDPFFTTKEPGKGTGLGLVISATIIKKHGGVIKVTSEIGTGTTFTISLPLSKTAEGASNGEVEQ